MLERSRPARRGDAHDEAAGARMTPEAVTVNSKFLVVDDHPLFLEALRLMIRTDHPGAEIAEATSLADAKALLAADSRFDVVLLDLAMPGTRGFDGLIELRTLHPRLPIVIVSAHEDPRIIHEAMTCGAAGYIPKSVRKDDLAAAIRDVLSGNVSLPKGYAPPSNSEQASRLADIAGRVASLTPQQLRVLQMIRQGKLNKQIAHELDVGETTVKAHVSEILRKLNVASRTQVVIEVSKIDFDSVLGQLPNG
jgi:DNA-binding NarL/FixJ family response regulator